MSYSLVYSAKPHSTRSIRVYTQDQHIHDTLSTLRACSKLIDAIFEHAFKYKAPKRLHIKGNKYMYIPSDAYDNACKLIRVKNFAK